MHMFLFNYTCKPFCHAIGTFIAVLTRSSGSRCYLLLLRKGEGERLSPFAGNFLDFRFLHFYSLSIPFLNAPRGFKPLSISKLVSRAKKVWIIVPRMLQRIPACIFAGDITVNRKPI